MKEMKIRINTSGNPLILRKVKLEDALQLT